MGPRWWAVIPTHVHYFTRESVAVALRRAGFEPLAGTTSPKTFTFAYYASRLVGYSGLLGNSAVRITEKLGLGDRLCAPDFRDRMLFVARAPG